MQGAVIIGIAGGSGSGKSTVISRIVETIGPDRISVLDHDAYYRDLSHLGFNERVAFNFDHPSALETEFMVEQLDALRRWESIEKPVYERIAAELAARFSKLVAGPHNADLDLGPLINVKQRDRVAGMVAAAKEAGVSVLAEGSVHPDAPKDGYYQAPVLFGSVDPEVVIAQEEVFGPVLTLFPFEGEEEAVRLANATEFGLVASVWTKDGARQHRVAKRVRAGQVFVNGYGAGGGIELPFGGFKKSGHGREKGFEALYDMSATKTVVFNHQ